MGTKTKTLLFRTANTASSAKKNRGQMAVFLALMLTTFLMLFTFVVNTGMLINAKISLQNAADLAAYAGASTQARQLNQISFLNYEMRRQYKRFLFRYYLLGNMAQATQPKNASESGDRRWSPDPTTGQKDYEVPAVCIPQDGENVCLQSKLAKIDRIPTRASEAISNTLNEQVLKRIEQMRQANCRAIGMNNLQILSNWLFNTDPTLSTVTAKLAEMASTTGDTNADRGKKRIELMKAVSQGLGLVPRQLLHSFRVQALERYVNAAPRALNQSTINGLMAGPDALKFERSIQAYLSAYQTLGEHVFDSDIQMTELLPPGPGGGSNLLKLNSTEVAFDAYGVDLIQDVAGSTCTNPGIPDPANPYDCIACVKPITVAAVPVGFSKDPSVLTYYALKLEAEAKVMFSPFGPMRLVAYAAAQPFGSRIGPVLNPADDLLWEKMNGDFCGIGAGAITCTPGAVDCCAGTIPNLPILADENIRSGGGWNNKSMQGALYEALIAGAPTAGATGVPIITPLGITRALSAGMAPNPWERGKYNILINDVSQDVGPNFLDDTFSEYFDNQGMVAFWAPLAESGEDPISRISTLLGQYFDTQRGSRSGATIQNILTDNFKEALLEGMRNYMQLLTQGQGEDGEGIKIARLRDPFNTPPLSNGAREPVRLPAGTLALSVRPDAVKTSWGDVKDANFRRLGRTGYSVKFVSFKTLISPSGETSDGATRWTNTGPLGAAIGADLEALKH